MDADPRQSFQRTELFEDSKHGENFRVCFHLADGRLRCGMCGTQDSPHQRPLPKEKLAQSDRRPHRLGLTVGSSDATSTNKSKISRPHGGQHENLPALSNSQR
jgi:hypothetical protein